MTPLMFESFPQLATGHAPSDQCDAALDSGVQSSSAGSHTALEWHGEDFPFVTVQFQQPLVLSRNSTASTLT
jgi:hypothetical protein